MIRIWNLPNARVRKISTGVPSPRAAMRTKVYAIFSSPLATSGTRGSVPKMLLPDSDYALEEAYVSIRQHTSAYV